MWSLMPNRYQVTAILALGGVAVLALQGAWAWLMGKPMGIVSAVSMASTVVVVGGAKLADWIWPAIWDRWPAIQRKTFPNLNGEWTGFVHPAANPKTVSQPEPIKVDVVIRQRLLSTVVSMTTPESASHSTRCWLEVLRETDRFRVWYTYGNEPKAAARDRSAPHEGLSVLEVRADDLNSMSGRYYTDRLSSGDIKLRRDVHHDPA